MKKHALKSLQIGTESIHKELYIAMRKPDTEIKYIQDFVQTGKDLANQKLESLVK